MRARSPPPFCNTGRHDVRPSPGRLGRGNAVREVPWRESLRGASMLGTEEKELERKKRGDA